ncbi:MAG: diaminopimelate epimerase [Sphingobacteriales bacterium]|nr:MAG: diaminopimelate epimerase [Sphingobacteriales bacterium]
MSQVIQFAKYQGTGNDFMLLDNRAGIYSLTQADVAALCHRRFGIGADGLMLLETTSEADFRMVYYNADGGISTLCGNGSRCMVAFAQKLGLVQSGAVRFEAADGLHDAQILSDGQVALQMADVTEMATDATGIFLNTGSPHYIFWTENADSEPVDLKGRETRYDPRFAPGGTNVNFVERRAADLYVRTYERGVEAETLSCGTGVTAAAIAASGTALGSFDIPVETPGGWLRVQYQKTGPETATAVCLTGPAQWVFEGTIDLEALLVNFRKL